MYRKTPFAPCKFGPLSCIKLRLGFTIFELVISLTLVVILGTLTAPSLQHLVTNHEKTLTTQKIKRTLEFARMSAIKWQQNVMVMPLQNHWNNGVQVVLADNKQLLRVESITQKKLSLQFRSSLGRSDAIVFTSLGFTLGQQGSFLICSLVSNSACTKIIILRSGDMRIAYLSFPQ